MAALHSWLRAWAVALLLSVLAAGPLMADGTQVTFDLPETIECRDVTSKEFAEANPAIKVIEAKLRISVGVTQGTERDIVDFRYFISSPDKRLRIQDYQPNTMLESTVADDQVEVSSTTEKAEGTIAEAHVSEHVLGLGGSKNQTSKTTASSHYKEIAPKALVLASGTTDREHGLFFKLQPSKEGSLEGAKEFTFRATVPKTWKGDWCMVSCAARARKKSFFSTTVVAAGGEMTDIGLYLAGDAEASALAKELRTAQDVYTNVLAMQTADDASLEKVFGTVSAESKIVWNSLLKNKKLAQENLDEQTKKRNALDEAEKAVRDVKEHLGQLAK